MSSPETGIPPRAHSNVRATGLWRSATVVMLLVMVAKGLGFLEKLILAYFAGAGPAVDAYVAAGTLAFFLYILVDDIVAPVFLTMYVTTRTRRGDIVASQYLRQVFAVTFVLMLCVVIVMLGWRSSLLRLLATGFDAEQQALTMRLLPWALWGGLCLGLSALTYVVLNAHGKFAWPEAAKLAYKVVVVGVIVLLIPRLGILGAGIALCVASATQLMVHLVAIFGWCRPNSTGPRVESTTSLWISSLRLMLPLAIGTLVAQFSSFVDINRGSTLPPGSVAALGYGRKLIDLPVLLVPGVLGIVALPRFARLVSEQRTTELMSRLSQLIEFTLVVFLPATVLLIWRSETIVELVFGRGEFDRAAVRLTSLTVSYFAIGLVAYAIEILIQRAYYALLDTKTPIIVGLVFVAVNIGMTISLTPLLGIIAIPLALATQKSLKVITLLYILGGRHGGPWLPRLGGHSWRILGGTLLFGLALLLGEFGWKRLWGSGAFLDVWGLAMNTSIATSLYILLLSRLGIIRWREAARQLMHRG